MPRPVHFDITAEDPDRAVSFYEQAFGWKFNHWGGGGPMDYWLIETGETQPGIDGGLSRRQEGDAARHHEHDRRRLARQMRWRP